MKTFINSRLIWKRLDGEGLAFITGGPVKSMFCQQADIKSLIYVNQKGEL